MPSYEKRASGLWTVRFRTIEDGTEKNKRLSGFPTKREAQQAYIEYAQAEKERKKEPVTSEGLLFDDLIELFLRYKSDRIKQGSLYDLQGIISKHILPYFSGKVIQDLKPADILAWQQSLDTYSYKHKANIRNTLTSIYKFAERYYDIINIMNRVEPFRNLDAKKEMLFWTKEEFQKFLAACDDTVYKTYFYILYITGCRKGEILALTWDDIDFEKSTITVCKNITKKVKDIGWGVTTTKNASSNRIIDMTPTAMELLREYRAWQAENYKSTDFVFCGDRPLPMTNLTRYFTRTAEKAGIKHIRIHDLRHSCASLLISAGVSIVAVSRRLGHKNIEQTLNTYSHMMPEDSSRIIAALDGI